LKPAQNSWYEIEINKCWPTAEIQIAHNTVDSSATHLILSDARCNEWPTLKGEETPIKVNNESQKHNVMVW